LLAGVSLHEPFFDHVFAPGEFVETTDDKFLASPAIKDETFHVTVVDGAAPAEPPTKTPATMLARRKRDFEEPRILLHHGMRTTITRRFSA
jgi:hypothetical protein